jgi:uncharacterized membrane protein
VAAGGASRIGAIVGGAAVAAVWATTFGWVNLMKYRKGRISKKSAIRKTTAESVGMGLATGVGMAAVNVIRASAFMATSAALVPFLVGTAVTVGAKTVWEHKVTKRLADPEEDASAEARGDEPQENDRAIAPEAAGSPT